MPPKKKSKKSVQEVAAHVHKKAKRKNIPTAELQDFVKEDETKPKKVLYSRDPSLDPQTNIFADFSGTEFEEQIDFYQHEQNWSNCLILGDSMLVMSSLAEIYELAWPILYSTICLPFPIPEKGKIATSKLSTTTKTKC